MSAILATENRDDLQIFLEQEAGKELLRFTTAGSVDDGKSTLIGRLLHDCKAVYEDQLDAVRKSKVNRSGKVIDLSLLTDGLRAEREQGITIDVAYRYFSTPRRKFIIADTPGHEQYTRNMATGASTADLAVILIDATKGLLQQTRRHAYIASLLGIPNVLAAVNKMDLAGYDEATFLRLAQDFSALAGALEIPNVQCIPISALEGDNVVSRGRNTPWYAGPTLLDHLETVEIKSIIESVSLRLPVQSVIRPDATFRGFAGRIASGTLAVGDDVLVLPSRQKTRVESIVTFDGLLDAATHGQSVVVKLADETDISRGDLLVSPTAPPSVSKTISAMVVWLHETPLEPGRSYLAKHLGRHLKLQVAHIRHRVDINELTQHSADRLAMNEIGFVDFEANQPLYFDAYQQNRTTGSFILIDPISNATVGAAMIQADGESSTNTESLEDATLSLESRGAVTLAERQQRRGHKAAVVLVRGTQESAEAVERDLFASGFDTAFIDYERLSTTVREPLLAAFWKQGLLSVVWTAATLDGKQKQFLTDIAGTSLYELTEEAADLDPQNRSALNFAETLRTQSRRHEIKGT